jgi:hypothetical protein
MTSKRKAGVGVPFRNGRNGPYQRYKIATESLLVRPDELFTVNEDQIYNVCGMTIGRGNLKS